MPLEGMLRLKFADAVPVQDLRNGFFHFLALTEFSYEFACLRCGKYPRILIADGNWANTCPRKGLYHSYLTHIIQDWIALDCITTQFELINFFPVDAVKQTDFNNEKVNMEEENYEYALVLIVINVNVQEFLQDLNIVNTYIDTLMFFKR